MKVLPFSIPKPEKSNLIFQEDKGDQFYDKLHQHQEIQLSCILKGEGSFFIGDSLGTFKQDEIFMIGENVPHVFSSEPSEHQVHMISLFFTSSAYGKDFFGAPEFDILRNVFANCELGFRLQSNQDVVRGLMVEMKRKSKIGRVVGLLQILEVLSKSETEVLSYPLQTRKYGEEEGKRMRDIMEYTFQNFDKSVLDVF